MKPSDYWSHAADEFERLVNEPDTIKWLPVVTATLPCSTRLYVEKWLVTSGLRFWMADRRIHNTILFKIDDSAVCFLHHDPEGAGHQWADKGFHNGIDNNMALARLARIGGLVSTQQESQLKQIYDKIDLKNRWESD